MRTLQVVHSRRALVCTPLQHPLITLLGIPYHIYIHLADHLSTDRAMVPHAHCYGLQRNITRFLGLPSPDHTERISNS